MTTKLLQDKPLDFGVNDAEIASLHAAVDAFATAMKARLAAKARQGWRGWDDPTAAHGLYTAMLAHAAGVRLARGHEVDVANFAMFLWQLSREAQGGHAA